MFLRNDAPASNTDGTMGRNPLDLAVAACLLVMATFSLFVLADQLGSARTYVVSPCRCGSVAGLALA